MVGLRPPLMDVWHTSPLETRAPRANRHICHARLPPITGHSKKFVRGVTPKELGEELKAVLKSNGLVRPDRSTYASMAPRGGVDAPTTFL
jgi:hypothetical protein